MDRDHTFMNVSTENFADNVMLGSPESLGQALNTMQRWWNKCDSFETLDEFLEYLKKSHQMQRRIIDVEVTDENVSYVEQVTEKAVLLGGFPFLNIRKGSLTNEENIARAIEIKNMNRILHENTVLNM